MLSLNVFQRPHSHAWKRTAPERPDRDVASIIAIASSTCGTKTVSEVISAALNRHAANLIFLIALR